MHFRRAWSEPNAKRSTIAGMTSAATASTSIIVELLGGDAVEPLRAVPEPADEARGAEDQQQVADDAAGDRGLDDLDVVGAQRDERDDQLRGVAERGVEQAAQRSGPDRLASSSVARPISPAAGISDNAAGEKHPERGCCAAASQLIGTATSSRLSQLDVSARRICFVDGHGAALSFRSRHAGSGTRYARASRSPFRPDTGSATVS